MNKDSNKKKSARKNSRKAQAKGPKFSPFAKPENMSMSDWQRALRRQGADAHELKVLEADAKSGAFEVVNIKRGTRNDVRFFGPDSEHNSCSCMDFRTNRLGTCKHLELVALRTEGRRHASADAIPYSSLYISYRREREVKLRIGLTHRDLFEELAREWTDASLVLPPEKYSRIAELISAAKSIDADFCVEDGVLEFVAEQLDAQRRAAMEAEISDDDINALVKTQLYPYQIEGVRKAFRAGKVIIADDMGLGKTVQAIATAELLRSRRMVENVLVVCPASLKYQWQREIERFCSSSTLVVEGLHTVRRRLLNAKQTVYTIISFQSLANDLRVMKSLHYDMVIIDEVQRLKNWDTKLSLAFRRLDSDYTVLLSGTPLENRIEELYSVMEFIDPYCLGPYHDFISQTVVRSDTGKVVGYQNLNEVGAKLKPRLIRRRKADVSIQMPERVDTIRYVTMTEEQRAIHNDSQSTVAQLVFKWQRLKFLSEKDRRRLLLELSRMRMVCDSTYILDQETRYDTKVEECIDLVQSAIDSGQKVVVFSQWERMTRLIAGRLKECDIKFEYLHGGVPSAKRGEQIRRFNSDDECSVFLSTDAGATGLNLQSASVIINIDLPWNQAVLEQRISRIYRIGQKRNIQVINLVAIDTIEERMLATLNFKASLSEGILDDGDDAITLSDKRLTRIAETYETMFTDADADTSDDSTDVATHEKAAAEPKAEPAEETTPEKTTDHPKAEPAANAPAPQPAANPHSFTSGTPTSDEVITSGVKFISSLAETLKSPEATRQLVDRLVKTDETTGQTTLQIPIPDKATVTTALHLLAALLPKS